jgi:hypothetical protein
MMGGMGWMMWGGALLWLLLIIVLILAAAASSSISDPAGRNEAGSVPASRVSTFLDLRERASAEPSFTR